jgi:hypothetical protein
MRRPLTVAYIGIVALLVGITGLLLPNPKRAPGVPPDPVQQIALALMILGGLFLVAVFVVSAVRERRDLRRIRRQNRKD